MGLSKLQSRLQVHVRSPCNSDAGNDAHFHDAKNKALQITVGYAERLQAFPWQCVTKHNVILVPPVKSILHDSPSWCGVWRLDPKHDCFPHMLGVSLSNPWVTQGEAKPVVRPLFPFLTTLMDRNKSPSCKHIPTEAGAPVGRHALMTQQALSAI